MNRGHLFGRSKRAHIWGVGQVTVTALSPQVLGGARHQGQTAWD